MGKIPIKGSEFSDTDLKFQVCSHMQPILELLEEHGNTYEHFAPLYRDKYSESKRVLERPIDFDLVEHSFEIPNFIVLSRKAGAILCQRCWCSIVEKP